MKFSDVSRLKHLREMIGFAEGKMGMTKVIAERRGTSAKIKGFYVHDNISHALEISVTLNTRDQRAHTNGLADIKRVVNDLKESLGIDVVRGMAQIKTAPVKPPRPTVKVKRAPRDKLTLFGNAKVPGASEPAKPHRDANPFHALTQLHAELHPALPTHVLLVLDGDGWIEESKFTAASGIERRALTLLRAGKPVKIRWAE